MCKREVPWLLSSYEAIYGKVIEFDTVTYI